MSSKIYTFNFDTKILKKLREVVNERQQVSLEKKHIIKNRKVEYFAWDRICVIMDRLDDTVEYINSMKLGCMKDRRSAFDFYEFINNAYIVVDCIRTIGQIFSIEDNKIKDIEKSQRIFGDVLNAGGNDGLFFEYIRSLCAVHPTLTNYSKYPYLKGDLFHCCPFVYWSEKVGLYNDDRDLNVCIYRSQEDSPPIDLPLYIEQFREYIEEWINLIPEVIIAIQSYSDAVYQNFRQLKMKKREEFNNDLEYLNYLKEENIKRYGDTWEYIYDQYIRVFKVSLTDKRNYNKLEKYKNAILYSLQFLHNSLQNMSSEGYENTGISSKMDHGELFELLSFPEYNKNDFGEFGYNLSKLNYLEYDSGEGNKQYSRFLLNEMKESINKYVFFTNTESDEETVVLVYVALYLSSLTNKCALNRNIPNNLDFRENLLTKNDIKILNKIEKVKKVKPISFDEMELTFVNKDGTTEKIKLKDLYNRKD